MLSHGGEVGVWWGLALYDTADFRTYGGQQQAIDSYPPVGSIGVDWQEKDDAIADKAWHLGEELLVETSIGGQVVLEEAALLKS